MFLPYLLAELDEEGISMGESGLATPIPTMLISYHACSLEYLLISVGSLLITIESE